MTTEPFQPAAHFRQEIRQLDRRGLASWAALAALEVAPPQDPQRYQVWLQTGDETLDYRSAERYYRACALRIQAGGDHSFQGFVERLPALLAFAGIAPGVYASLDFSVL